MLLRRRAAEVHVIDELSTAGAVDLAKATNIARSMVMRYGMDEELGQVAYEQETTPFLDSPAAPAWQPRRSGEETASEIDTAVRDIVRGAFESACDVLREHRESLERGAAELLEKEILDEHDLARLLPVRAKAATS